MSFEQDDRLAEGAGKPAALRAQPDFLRVQPDFLRVQIDALATRAMIASGEADSVAPLLASLSDISRQAAEAGFASVPPVIEELERTIQDGGAESGLEPLLSCIGRLQNLLETEEPAAQEPEAEEPEADENEGRNQEAGSEPAKTSQTTATRSPAIGSAPGGPLTTLSIAADPELLGEFFGEARDHLISIEAQLLVIEQKSAEQKSAEQKSTEQESTHESARIDALHTVFRSFHTIKGLAGFLDLTAIREVAHEVETLLDLARNEKLTITAPVIDVILESADYLKADIARIERELNGAAPSESLDCHDLLQRIEECHWGSPGSPSRKGLPALENLALPEKQEDLREAEPVGAGPAIPRTAPRAPAHPQSQGINGRTAEAVPPTAKAGAVVESRVVKVDIGKLDFLMDIVGELVIAQSMVTHDRSADAAANPKLQRNLAQLTRITGEVQKTAMAMRMVPVGQLFKRSVRLVRDLMRKSGKDAELVLSGEETEVDRNIVEELADPLMHMIRNAADHAIEPPEERVRAGKEPKGRIQLKAYHQAGSIMIEVADDGRGLDREKILRKARERGLIGDGSHLTDKEVFNLIFEPGFSTAEKVTDISGRGVGMDVVRKQIQRMRGRVDIESKLGQGTTFLLKLPLTLAIIDGLVVGVGSERYIAPIYAVREMFRPAAGCVFTVEGQAEMVLVRGGLLPVVRLYRRFSVTPKNEDITQSLLVVVESETRSFCLVVDELIDTQEVVIKNLGETFRKVSGIAGGTILGDGRVGLILDIDGLFTGKADA